MHHFETSVEFTRWKDGMEEKDYVYYTKQKEYKLSEGTMRASQYFHDSIYLQVM